MKHCILVKFNKDFDLRSELENIKSIFDSIDIEGVFKVEYIQNCVDRENRYDLLIRINMDKNSLDKYDASKAHHIWKENYAKFIEKKAIFDYE